MRIALTVGLMIVTTAFLVFMGITKLKQYCSPGTTQMIGRIFGWTMAIPVATVIVLCLVMGTWLTITDKAKPPR